MTLGPGNIVESIFRAKWSYLGWNVHIGSAEHKGNGRGYTYVRSRTLLYIWSASFMVKLSHPYKTTGKTIALTRWTFVGKRTLSSNLILWGIFWKFPSPKISFFPCVFDIYLNIWHINLYLGYFIHSLLSPQCFSLLLKFIFFFLFVE